MCFNVLMAILFCSNELENNHLITSQKVSNSNLKTTGPGLVPTAAKNASIPLSGS